MINLVFDIETVPDWGLLFDCEHELGEKPEDTKKRYLDVLRKKQNRHELEEPFIPAQYQIPVVVSMMALGDTGEYLQHRVMTATTSKERLAMIKEFWGSRSALSELSQQECRFVSFNGKRFDVPVMEACAMRHGITLADWFVIHTVYANQNPRAPYNHDAHLDLLQVMSSPGAGANGGGMYGTLSYWCTLTGSPGKICMDGSQVANLFSKGEIKTIGDYCLADVMSTAALFLRLLLISGYITEEAEGLRLDEMMREVSASDDTTGDCVSAWSQECARLLAARRFTSGLAADDEPPF